MANCSHNIYLYILYIFLTLFRACKFVAVHLSVTSAIWAISDIKYTTSVAHFSTPRAKSKRQKKTEEEEDEEGKK